MNLKPCPFCAFPKLETLRTTDTWKFVVACPECSALGPIGDTEQEAHTNWNRRAGS